MEENKNLEVQFELQTKDNLTQTKNQPPQLAKIILGIALSIIIILIIVIIIIVAFYEKKLSEQPENIDEKKHHHLLFLLSNLQVLKIFKLMAR